MLDHWLGRFIQPEQSQAVRRQRAEVFAKSLSPALDLARDAGVSLPGTALAHGLIKRVMGVD